MIRVETSQYEVSHGHKPRQPRGSRTSPWAFTIDGHRTVWITGRYADALQAAKRQAQYCVTVLP